MMISACQKAPGWLVATSRCIFHLLLAGAVWPVMGSLALAARAAPANDHFASAQELSGSTLQVMGSSVGATKERDEPRHAGQNARRSVWYRWNAPASGSVTIDTVGSGFNTVLAVYTGSTLTALAGVAANNDISGSISQSRVTFNAVQGTDYKIAVDGVSGASGSVVLNLSQGSSQPLSNDLFTNAQSLSGSSGLVNGSNIGFTKETGEPNHAGNSGGRSAWYQWTAPVTGSVSFDTVGSNFDTLLATYMGSSVSSLTQVAANDDINYSGGNYQSRISFNATAGTLYRIAVDGYDAASGSITLNWNQTEASIPPHDNLANARLMSNSSGLDSSSNVGATKEAGEPNHAGNAGGASVWYKWTAPISGNATLSTEGSGFNTLLAIYTGNNYTDLVLRYSNDDIGAGNVQSSAAFEAVIGVTYLIAVDGSSGASGNLVLQWSLSEIGPANDHFSAATLLSGSAGTVYGATVGATKETGEPNHAGNTGGASVWYLWTAPSGDSVSFNTIGSTFDTLLAVYTGSSLSGLTLVAQNNNDGSTLQSRVAFTPVSGTTYRIAVDGHNGVSGNLTLNWAQGGVGPANDHFANAQAISGGSGQTTASSVNATKEAGEPNNAGVAGGASIWFVWTAPAGGLMFFETLGSSFDTVLAVYSGGSLSSLTSIASNNDLSPNYRQSRVQFNAVAGATYRIAVDGVSGVGGSVKLGWNSGAVLPDLVVWPNSANPGVFTQSFDSSHCAVQEGLITAGTHRLLRFNTETRNQGTADLSLGSPAGNPLFEYATCHGHYHLYGYMSYRLLDESGGLVNTGFKTGFCLLDSTRWDPDANTSARYDCSNQGIQKGWGDVYTYHLDGQWIVIDGVPDGLYYLEMVVNPYGVLQELDYSNNTVLIPVRIGGPPNDHFASAQELESGFTTVSSYNLNASAESGEPSHAGVTARRSVWFKWRPASNQAVTLDTVGSTFDSILAVYTGTSVSQLTSIAANDDISYPGNLQSRVSFTAVSGTDYLIAVDGYGGAMGDIKLNRSLSSSSPQSLAGLPPGLSNLLVPPAAPPAWEHSRGRLGELKLIIRGNPNKIYLIEASSDLVNWQPITTTLATPAGLGFFIDKSNSENHREHPPHGNLSLPADSHFHPSTKKPAEEYYPPLFFRSILLEKAK